jgi:hypothetical protein
VLRLTPLSRARRSDSAQVEFAMTLSVGAQSKALMFGVACALTMPSIQSAVRNLRRSSRKRPVVPIGTARRI